jgi:hypothetical protein
VASCNGKDDSSEFTDSAVAVGGAGACDRRPVACRRTDGRATRGFQSLRRRSSRKCCEQMGDRQGGDSTDSRRVAPTSANPSRGAIEVSRVSPTCPSDSLPARSGYGAARARRCRSEDDRARIEFHPRVLAGNPYRSIASASSCCMTARRRPGRPDGREAVARINADPGAGGFRFRLRCCRSSPC